MSRDISIIIPSRSASALGLWATVHSCEEDLKNSGIDYDFVVATNGQQIDKDTKQLISSLKTSGRLGEHIHCDDPIAPPMARQRAASVSTGRLLFFFDNHCLVAKDYFRRMVMDFDNPDIDILHPAVIFYIGDKTYYDYQLQLKDYFWGSYKATPKIPNKPYMTACAGHGAFAVRKTAWDLVEGYCPEGVLVGYAGEEVLFNLKSWMYGVRTYIDSKAIHYHYPGTRGYLSKFTDDYYTNLMVSAYIVGGDTWMYKVYESLSAGGNIRSVSPYTMFELMQTAYDRSKVYASQVRKRSKMSLDELLIWFRSNDVSM